MDGTHAPKLHPVRVAVNVVVLARVKVPGRSAAG
jgi:hypothetical protein